METGTWVVPPEEFAARVHGACVCGAVRWSYDAPFQTMLHCHCSTCRKHHGTLFSTWVIGPLPTFHWRGGTEQIATWPSSPRGKRSYCTRCGSKVPTVDHERQLVFMPAGALDGEIGIRPQLHIFMDSKPPWHRVHDGLPQHAAYPPAWDAGPGQPTPDRPGPAGVTRGSCACGAVRYELEGRPVRMVHCHCSRCRHARGAAHATNAAWKLDALRFTAGADAVRDFQLPSAQHFGTAFCTHCGGFVPRCSAGRGWAVVPVGTLDTDPQYQPTAHQFVTFKAPWFQIDDGVPQYPEAEPPPRQEAR